MTKIELITGFDNEKWQNQSPAMRKATVPQFTSVETSEKRMNTSNPYVRLVRVFRVDGEYMHQGRKISEEEARELVGRY